MPNARNALIAGVAAAVALAGAGCGASSATGTGSEPGRGAVVKVVAAENFWGDVTAQIGGSHVTVRSIITDPSADPHQYESDATDAEAVAEARVVVENGLGYDAFIAKLLSVTSNDTRVVVSVADVLHVTGADANPHLWYDLPRVPTVAQAIEAALVAADPADAAAFAKNLKTFDATMAPLSGVVDQIRSQYHGAPVAYTERVPQYLLEAAGLTVVTPSGFAQAIEDGNEPGARDRQAMDDLVSTHRIRALLYNSQATSPVTEHVQDLARDAGVPVVAVTETQPRNEPSYQAWQLAQLRALLAALARKPPAPTASGG